MGRASKVVIISLGIIILFLSFKNGWALFKQEPPSEVYVYTLMEKAQRSDTDTAVAFAKEAIKIAPEMPGPYFFLARKVFSLNPESISESAKYLFEGLRNYTNSFWQTYNFIGTVLSGVWLSLVITIVAVSLVNLIFNLPLFVHTVLENKRKGIIAAVAILSLLGIAPLLGVITFFGFWGAKGRSRRLFLFLMISILIVLTLGAFLSQYLLTGLSPSIKAEVGVNSGRGSSYPEWVFRNRGFNSLFSKALSMQNRGLLDNSISIYKTILNYKEDARVYVNLGNCYALKGDLQEAVEFYNKAVLKKPLASAYYNLSVITREFLEFVRADKYFMKAVSIDMDKIESIRELQKKESSQLLMNETLSAREIFQAVVSKSLSEFVTSGYFIKAGVIVFLIMLFYYLSRDRAIAQRCRKCGKIYCIKCESRIHWSALCSDCFKTMVSFEIPATERIEHIMKAYSFQKKRRTLLYLLSWFLPGVSLTPRMPFRGVIISFLFFLFLSLILLSGIFDFNLWLFEQNLFRILYLSAAVVIYLYGVSYTRRKFRRGLI